MDVKLESLFAVKCILDENNWSSYKYHAETFAMKIEADDIIDGKEVEPTCEESSTNAEKIAQYEASLKLFEDKSRKMYFYLRSTQSESTRIHLHNVKKNDARGAWKALCDYYESSSMASIKQLLTKLVRLKQVTSVPMFIDELGRLKGQLKTAVAEKKQDIMDVLSQMVLLDGLKPEFDAVKQILLLDDSLTFEQCKQRVLETAERLKIDQDESTAALSYSQALRSQTTDPGGPIKTAAVGAHPDLCPHCNKRWHSAEKCWKLHPGLKDRFHSRASKAAGGNDESKDANVTQSSAWRVQSVLPASQAHIARVPSQSNVISFDLDSASSDHFVNSFKGVSNFDPSSHIEVELANGSKVCTAGQGSIADRLPVIHYAPTFASPLLSVARLNDDNKAVLFHPRKGVLLMDAAHNDAVLAVGYRAGNSFKLDVTAVPPPTTASAAAVTSVTPVPANSLVSASTSPEWKLIKSQMTKARIVLLHNRADHPSATRMYHAYHHQTTTGMCLPVGLLLADFQEAISNCEACRLAKSKAQPHRPRRGPRPQLAPFEALAVDIKGPIELLALGGERFIVMIVCLATDMHYSYPIRYKSDELQVLQRFEGQVVRSQGYHIRSIRWDNAKEQRSRAVDAWLTSSGIRSEPTAEYSSAMNGAAERAIQTDAAVARTLRIAAHFPKSLFAELFRTASFLHQFSPSRLNDDDVAAGQTPYERLHGRKPDVSFLRTIGCVAYVHIHKPCRKALDPTAVKGRLIGYTSHPRGYRVLLPDNRIVSSPHVTFSESGVATAPGYYNQQGPVDPALSDWCPSIEMSTSSPTPPALSVPSPSVSASSTSPSRTTVNPYSVLSSPTDDDDDDDAAESASPAPLSGLPPASPSPSEPSAELRLEQYLEPELSVLAPAPPTRTGLPACSLSRLPPPSSHAKRVCAVKKITYTDALRDDRLRQSMLKELTSLFSGSDPPAEIVDLPPGRRPIGCTWAHKFKYKATGEFDRAKSRVCPLGYQQVPGIDYDPAKVTSPVISLGGSFLFLNIAVQRRMTRTLLDVDSAFTIPTLHEEVYMRFPPGMKATPGKAIRLRHSIYGLKQSGFNWHEKAHAFLAQQGFQHSQIEPCLYWKWVGDTLQMVALYVDDFHIAVDDPDHMSPIIDGFKSVFPCKTANGSMYLGMIITDCPNGDVEIGQEACIDGLLTLLGLTDCAPVSTPAVPNRRLLKAASTDPSVQSFPYRAAIGSLLWLARCSRPDIFFAVTQLAAHASCYNIEHVQAVKHCARYLKGTRHLRLRLRHGASGIILRAYADADFAGEPQENEKPMHSLSGSVLYIAGTGPVFWQSKLQPTISRSTAEAEYRSSGVVAQHIAAYRTILQELGFLQTDPTIIYEDNQACIAMTKSLLCSSKARHIKLDHHYIRQQVREGEVTLQYCDTAAMVADIFTKALPKPQFQKLRDMLMSAL